MIEHRLHEIYTDIGGIFWRETMFENLQYFYAENELYLIRTLESNGIYHYAFIKETSPDRAISVFMGLKPTCKKRGGEK